MPATVEVTTQPGWSSRGGLRVASLVFPHTRMSTPGAERSVLAQRRPGFSTRIGCEFFRRDVRSASMPIQPAPEGTVAAPVERPVERPFMEYEPDRRVGRFRWVILALVFLAITINYI